MGTSETELVEFNETRVNVLLIIMLQKNNVLW